MKRQKQISSYKAKIIHFRDIFKATVRIYRNAIAFLVDIINAEWDIISESGGKYSINIVERLTHKTAKNPNPKHDFDSKFPKMPSYLRRCAIQAALGIVSSYRTRLAKWEDNGRKGKEPKLQPITNLMPAFYHHNMFKDIDDTHVEIKVFHNGDWIWLTVELRWQDVKYMLNHCSDNTKLCPVLKNKGKCWYLVFPYESEIWLSETKQVAVAVDLGINNVATMTAMLSDGTILGRKVVKLSREQDHLNRRLGKIKKAHMNGNKKTPRLWELAKNINTEISRKTALAIIGFALEFNADVIVFEHLDFKGKKRGKRSNRVKLHHWKHREVQKIVENRAHIRGIRLSRICAWNTSKLAFDGSGAVERDKDNYSMCTFKGGKRYHCDLNASYNIAARYHIREILKSFSETERQELGAKVPAILKRTTCTLSSLISLNAVLAS
jgi:IS605 OrfB family transposase